MSAAPGDVAGVAVDSSGGAVSGVRIQGPGEITGYDIGVRFIGAGGVSNSSVSRLTVANNSGGIFFQFGSGNTVSRNTANHNGIGIILQAESGDTVSRNTANDNDQLGIDLILAAHGNTVSGNTANNDGQTGIQVLAHSTGNTISGNAAHNNSVDDLYDGNTGCDTNTWTGNSFKTANQPCIN
jgi:parallel beta-helix repeat protein